MQFLNNNNNNNKSFYNHYTIFKLKRVQSFVFIIIPYVKTNV